MLTVEGAFVAAVGSRGSQPLQFNNPCDVAVHHNGKIFVTDQQNHRVQVLNPDLSLTLLGDKPGELDCPHGIAIDQEGMVYVSDTGNSRIQLFTSEGTVLKVDESIYYFFRPYGLCIDSNNILYVVDWINNIVLVFNGQFPAYIGNSDGSTFNKPKFIATNNRDLYISESSGIVTSYTCYQK